MATKTILTDLDFGSIAKITNLPSPTAAQEPATKGYVDGLLEGLAWKEGARVASTANINLSSPGATIDGIAMVANDRVLVKDQSTASQNGIYIWNGAAVPMTRSADADTADSLEQAVLPVEEGTSAGASFRQTLVAFTLDSGSIAWASFGASAAAATEAIAGVAEIATQAETDGGTDDQRFITALKLATWASRPKRFAANVGDGSALTYDITHSFGTRDVTVEVYRNSGNYDTVIVDIQRTDVNTVRLVFAAAPASNAYRVVIKY